jgi:C-terminal processing protease CtpA/Prc
MRINGGGDSKIGDELFQYISPVSFQQFNKTIVRYSSLQKKLALENFGNDLSKKPDGIETTDSFDLIPLRPNPVRFTGNVYLLISHKTFSSAGSFSWTFKKFNMGTIFGEESGGMSVCFGDIVIYKLPHSKINSTISFARMYEYDSDEYDIHGTIPDVAVEQEKALEHVLEYIKNAENR